MNLFDIILNGSNNGSRLFHVSSNWAIKNDGEKKNWNVTWKKSIGFHFDAISFSFFNVFFCLISHHFGFVGFLFTLWMYLDTYWLNLRYYRHRNGMDAEIQVNQMQSNCGNVVLLLHTNIDVPLVSIVQQIFLNTHTSHRIFSLHQHFFRYISHTVRLYFFFRSSFMHCHLLNRWRFMLIFSSFFLYFLVSHLICHKRKIPLYDAWNFLI